VALLVTRDGEWRESFDGLPWALIDQVVVGAEGRRRGFAPEEGQVCHDSSREEEAHQAGYKYGCRHYDCESSQLRHGSTLNCPGCASKRTEWGIKDFC
jgi:hypothetical protein